jgi:virulence factor Mce-like protein
LLTVAAVLAASGLTACGSGGGSYTLVAYFPRAVSLYESSNVRVLGLPAGEVKKIEVLGDRVKVTLSMQSGVPVPENVKAQIVPQSLIGERYVQLFPAWKEGQPKAQSGHEIGKDDPSEVIIPVEPDEALAALNTFLQKLDPEGLGRLISNAADDLHGNGQKLNDALNGISSLVATFAAKDQQLVNIVDSFDRLTTTLRTRESQLGDIITTFSQATQTLADERQNLQALLASLSSLSQNALDLVVKHSDQLHSDIDKLTRLAQSINANLSSIDKLLTSGPMVASGLANAYDPLTHSTRLRTELGPLVGNLLGPLLTKLGIPYVCIPIDTACTASATPLTGQAAAPAANAILPKATTPVDSLLDLVSAKTVKPAPAPSTGTRVADAASAVGSFFGDAFSALVGAS